MSKEVNSQKPISTCLDTEVPVITDLYTNKEIDLALRAIKLLLKWERNNEQNESDNNM